MKKLKFFVPVLALLLAVIGVFATFAYGTKGVDMRLVNVTANQTGCSTDGKCSGSGSTCQVGSCVLYVRVAGEPVTCQVPALGSFSTQ